MSQSLRGHMELHNHIEAPGSVSHGKDPGSFTIITRTQEVPQSLRDPGMWHQEISQS